MSGIRIANETYVRGDSSLGSKRINISIVGNTGHLSFIRRDNGEEILSIPWMNLREGRVCAMEKSTFWKITANAIGWLPIIEFTDLSDDLEWGFYISYWDEATQREQRPIIAVGGDQNRSIRLLDEIWRLRDEYYRAMGANSTPQRR